MDPLVTVLMPVYNGEHHLRSAIESILGQTYSHFELLIMDDGSTDNSSEIVNSIDDKRIRYHRSPTNKGIEQTLNDGLLLAHGTYIARMDADDISLPQRLALQISYLESHPETGVIGGAIRKLKDNRPGKLISPPLSDGEIRVHLLFHNPLHHPVVMFRKQLVVKHPYPLDYKYAEDYRLWVELSAFTKFANLPDEILHYRIHDQQITKSKSRISRNSSERVKIEYLNMLFPELTPEERSLHLQVIGSCHTIALQTAEAWLEKLAWLNETKQVLNHNILLKQLGHTWLDCCRKSSMKGTQLHRIFKNSRLRHYIRNNRKNLLKYYLKVVLPEVFAATKKHPSKRNIAGSNP